MRGSAAFLGAYLLLSSSPASAGEDGLGRMAAELERAAWSQRLGRVAVLPFSVPKGVDPGEGRDAAERLTTHLARGGRVQVVERSLLALVLKEQKLALSGLLGVPSQTAGVWPVDAIVTGHLLERKGYWEAHGRLIQVAGGRVAFAAHARLGKAPPRGGWGGFDVSVPDLDVPPPDLRDALADADCDGAQRRIAEMEAAVLELKSRYWAARTREPAFPAARLMSNPGSEIQDPVLRRRFYEALGENRARAQPRPLAPGELAALRKTMRAAADLARTCGIPDGELDRAARQLGE